MVRSRFIAVVSVIAAAVLALVLEQTGGAKAYDIDRAPPAPEFTHHGPEDWINSSPLKLADLRGRVVLLDFWTFDCWNCYRSFPWLKSVEKRFEGRELTVIGVHTPEFKHERIRANVVRKVKEFMLDHPVMIDNDYSYWNAVGNRFWPAFYLIDKQGRIRSVYFGETHASDRRATEIERRISDLLAERAS